MGTVSPQSGNHAARLSLESISSVHQREDSCGHERSLGGRAGDTPWIRPGTREVGQKEVTVRKAPHKRAAKTPASSPLTFSNHLLLAGSAQALRKCAPAKEFERQDRPRTKEIRSEQPRFPFNEPTRPVHPPYAPGHNRTRMPPRDDGTAFPVSRRTLRPCGARRRPPAAQRAPGAVRPCVRGRSPPPR